MSPDRVTRLGILLSGRGSNFLAIDRAIREQQLPGAEIGLVLSNRADSPGLQTAVELGLPTLMLPSAGRRREEHDADVVRALHEHRIDLVCLAGYMRLLSQGFVQAFPQRILNIHPSLLPSFPGLDAQQQALNHGVAVTGCTVHFVDEELDHGVIVLQQVVVVDDTDTKETLSARILDREHQAYPEAILRVIRSEYHVVGRRYVRRSS